MNIYDRIFKPRLIVLSDGKKVYEKRSRAPLIALVLIFSAYISVRITGFSFTTLFRRGNQFWVILGKMFPPDLSYAVSIWTPLFDTIKMSIIGSLAGSIAAVPFAVLSSSNIVKNKAVIFTFRLFFSLLRTLPTLVTALIATFIFGLGTTAGTLAVALFTFAYVGKLLYEEIETTDMGPYEAMLALGCTKTRCFILSVIPQVLPLYLSSCLYCFEGNVRYAAILGYVGAGGIGLILNSQIGWRNYSKVGMILIILFFTVVIIEYLSYYLRQKLTRGGAMVRKSKPSPYRNGMTVQEMYEARPRAWICTVAVIVLSALILAWSSTAFCGSDGSALNGLAVAKSILHGILHPSLSLLFNFTKEGVPYLLLETLSIAFLGTLVGAVLSVPFAFLGARNIAPRPVALLFRTVVMAIRTIPAFVYGLMFIRVTGPGPFAGLLTMSVCSIGMISKMFSESIEDIEKGILESLDASGCNTFEKIRCGIIPQISASFASTLIYRFDMNLRDTTVLGLVGAGGIGAPLIFAMNGYKWDQAGAILAGLVILILVIEWFSSRIRTKLARGPQ